MKKPGIDVLRAVMHANERRDKAAFLAHFAPEVEYHYHVGSRPLQGKDWVDRFVTKYWANHSATKWSLLRWAETGNALLTEGIEEYVNADGALVRHPYMGVIEFDADGRIVAWRDYFQMNDPAAGRK
jgi:limonene-1,2-epoxide hydrolase